jgi:hypothetical protein
MAVIVYENALTDINCSDLFQSETVPYDWEEHEFEHDGITSDTHGHSEFDGKAALTPCDPEESKESQSAIAMWEEIQSMKPAQDEVLRKAKIPSGPWLWWLLFMKTH